PGRRTQPIALPPWLQPFCPSSSPVGSTQLADEPPFLSAPPGSLSGGSVGVIRSQSACRPRRPGAPLPLHVITEQDILIAQVEPAARDHGMGPGGLAAPLRLLEPSLLHVSLRSRLDEGHRAALASD